MTEPRHSATQSVTPTACQWQDWRCTDPLPARRHAEIVRIMALDGCKWDAQVGDVAVLLPFVLTLPRSEWERLATTAESLAAELLAMEEELKSRPDLWRRLGLPARVCAMLAGPEPWTPAAARVMRFDFHPTAEGWRISEVNSDVPGGFNEASRFTALMAAEFSGCRPVGDPLTELATALAGAGIASGSSREGGEVHALISAPGYTEDHQVIAGVANALRERGLKPVIARIGQLTWKNGAAELGVGSHRFPVRAIYRFVQGEWLSSQDGAGAALLFRGGVTPVCNPGSATLSESKRLPLLWPHLQTPRPSWERLLPVCREPEAALLGAQSDWVLKPAYGNTGDFVTGSWNTPRSYRARAFWACLRRRRWLAQRRFETVQMETPSGFLRPCLGIYVIQGRACGIYGRMSRKEWVDYAAHDVAVCVRE